MYRVLARLAVLSAALILATPTLADLVGNPHIHVGAINLGGGFIQYTIDMHNPLGLGIGAEVTAMGNFNQIDTDGVSSDPDGPGPLPSFELLPPGPVDLFTQIALADVDPSYAGAGGSAADSWWDNSDLSAQVAGGVTGGEVGSMTFSFFAHSPALSEVFLTRLGQLVVFDPAAAGIALGSQRVVESGLAPFSFVNDSRVFGAGMDTNINGSFAVLPEPPTITLAALDIKPGSDQNPVNLKSRGVLPVAILTTDEFDALQVDLASIVFGDPVLLDDGAIGVGPLRSDEKDVNGDGLTDLTLKFSMRDLVDNGALGGLSIEAILTGLTFDGMMFEASDSIRLVPPGDANNDQIVNAADYIIWADNFGSNGANTPGDFDENNHVDAGDYTMWANNFGTNLSAPGSVASAVPEPSTFVLSTLGLLGLIAHGWRRRRRA